MTIGRRILSVLFAMVMIVAFAGVSSAGAPVKVDVCHFDADTGTFHQINISENAFDAHIAHGDAGFGQAVPGQPGYVFAADSCEIVADPNYFADSQGFWHKGEPSQDCITVCAPFGGVDPPSCLFSWKRGYNALAHFFPTATYQGQAWSGIYINTYFNRTYTSGGWNASPGLVLPNIINVCPCEY